MQIHWADYLSTLIIHTATMTTIILFNVSAFYAGGAETEELYGLLKITHNSSSKGVNVS